MHVPHAGTFIDPDVRSALVLDDESLHEELRVMTDWFTDVIARRACERSGIGAVVYRNPRSRLVIDPCLLYTSPSPRDRTRSRMPSSA